MTSQRVLELLESDSDFSDFENEFSDSESEEELIEKNDHDSKSEQELSSSDENSESVLRPWRRCSALRAKSGVEFSFQCATRSPKHRTGEPSAIGVAMSPKSPLEIFNLFIPPALINEITDHTNQRIEMVKEQYNSKYCAGETTS
ncbi:Hypothetical predicted protein [Octopus vulgaris]|uniref:Uncharacterized protein n=1 Tax=Octopus vulgaris TaxID=6645 RepID=A0AA36F0T7_OCTVU|nr:Hypothetical predicted protein [Octopus vulgaris]